MVKTIFTAAFAAISFAGAAQDTGTRDVCPDAGSRLSPDKTLWYNAPATDWNTQALHLGNGFMGASFYGGIDRERFDVAEKTFWAGGPNVVKDLNNGIIEGGKEHIAEIRKAISEDRIADADALVKKHMFGNWISGGSGYFSKVGNLFIDFAPAQDTVIDYVRGLDLAQSVGFVRYKSGGVQYRREYLCSYPDKVLAVRLSADRNGQISFTVYQEMQYKAESVEVINGNEIVIRGLIDKSGLKYCARIKALQSGGKLIVEQGRLKVENADEASVLYTVATEYDANAPLYKGKNPVDETAKVMKKLSGNNFNTVKERHVRDYQTLFNRASLTLTGDRQLEQLPTDKRVEQLIRGTTDDSALKALYFNFGRYLLISASRPGTLPSNLQGVWNNAVQAQWNGNYQSNANLQMMYWGAGPTNLPECQSAYVDFIEGLVAPGRKTAQSCYGTGGWVSHSVGNIWGYTAPGSDILWGVYPAGSAWHCRHLWEQYDFTGDTEYLKRVYPVMKEAAQFYLENLMMYRDGLVLTPSGSAEHGIEIKDGKPVEYSTIHGEATDNRLFTCPAFQDVQMIHDLFGNVISASRILDTDRDFRSKLLEARNKLMKPKIGKYGQLQEWVIDADNPRDHHRHIAHLYALYPGSQITASGTPELFEAARVSLNMRGEGIFLDRWQYSGGNWSMAWRVACWARLLDGERAMKVFNLMIKDTGFGNMMTSQHTPYHRPMQVDASMATPGLFAEMLMQSHDNCINLLPALPAEWTAEGEVKGLVARGGYIIDIHWKHGQLEKAQLTVPRGKTVPKLKLKSRDVSPEDTRIRLVYLENKI